MLRVNGRGEPKAPSRDMQRPVSVLPILVSDSHIPRRIQAPLGLSLQLNRQQY
jgi:hypothetical protein